MDAQLLIRIVETYTKPGETILDQMAGSGTTMLACMLGRNVVLVELEERFVKMCQDNWEKVKMHHQLGYEMGTCQIIQGDARQLENILCDSIVTSPPYAGGEQFHDLVWIEKERKRPHNPQQKQNMSNLPYGQINHIITSPPYEGALEASSRHTKGGIPGKDKVLGQTGTYATLEDAEIIAKKVSKGFQSPEAIKMIERLPRGYAQNPSNIGNLKGGTYLSAMLAVYKSAYKVLKSGGLMILVVKSFIREQKIIDLAADTIRLCETAGFALKERWYRELPAQSFWRVLYHRKYPSAPQLKYEDILVFLKV